MIGTRNLGIIEWIITPAGEKRHRVECNSAHPRKVREDEAPDLPLWKEQEEARAAHQDKMRHLAI